MPVARRRGRRFSSTATAIGLAVALVVHGALLGSVHAFGIGLAGASYSHKDTAQPELAAADVDLKPTCLGDAIIGSWGRYALCFAPWEGDVDRCFDDAGTNLWIDLSSCSVRDEKALASVAMLEPRQSDQVKSIDPEPLLEMLQEPPKKQPPPPQLVQVQPAPPPPPPPQARQRPMQVVETAKPNNEQAPDNARFLAEFDTRVEHQTVARGTPKEPMVAKSKPEELQAKDHPQEASIKEREDRPRGADPRAPDAPGTLSMRRAGPTAPAELQQDQKVRGSSLGGNGPVAFDGYVPRKGQGAIDQEHRERSEIPRGQGGAGGGTPEVPNLKPSQDVLERALGGGNVDHMEEVDNGDETALNAKRWVYASFFNRLKRQVAQNWDPASVWRRLDPTGQVYGFKTRVTEVRVSLSRNGELSKIVVTSPSGVNELDDEAVRSFHQAAPFPNPPKELVGNDGSITFAFSFFFEIGSPHTSWRVIRSM